MNCEVKELVQKNFCNLLSCAWEVIGFEPVFIKLAVLCLVHSTTRVVRLIKVRNCLIKSLLVNVHSFCVLDTLYSHPHCNSSSTDEIPARNQKYQHNGSIKFNSSVAGNSQCMFSLMPVPARFAVITVLTSLTSQPSSLRASEHCGQTDLCFGGFRS
jgi:hypothetical protein